MRIGELARRAHTTRDTVRFYERRGLLGRVGREPSNSYKDYPQEALTRLCMIRYLKGLGFTLREIAEGLDAWVEGRLPLSSKLEHVRRKLDEVVRRERELALLRHALEDELVRLDATARASAQGTRSS